MADLRQHGIRIGHRELDVLSRDAVGDGGGLDPGRATKMIAP
jgi:hypothetical protein